MSDIQKLEKELVRFATYPPYPPHHQGDYLEEYFYNFYQKNKDQFSNDIIYIPILWTNYSIHQACIKNDKLEGFLDKNDILTNYLNTNYNDPNKKYFTISQSGIPKKYAKKNWIIFSCDEETGTFGKHRGDIPIPYLCYPHQEKNSIEINDRKYLASFTGTYTTHYLRTYLKNKFQHFSDFFFSGRQYWGRNFKEKEVNDFINGTLDSKFTLCPRGAGKQSFRIAEAMELQSIPVYISDELWLPYKDELDWSSFAVIIKNTNEIDNLRNKLISYSDEDLIKMLEKINEIYQDYFTLEGVSNYIKSRINNL